MQRTYRGSFRLISKHPSHTHTQIRQHSKVVLTGCLACSRLFSTCCHLMCPGHKFNSLFYTLQGIFTTNYYTPTQTQAHPHTDTYTSTKAHRHEKRYMVDGQKKWEVRKQKEKMRHSSVGAWVFCFPEFDRIRIQASGVKQHSTLFYTSLHTEGGVDPRTNVGQSWDHKS